MKPLARRFLKIFGDFWGILLAPAPRLLQMSGVGPAVVCELKVVEAAAHRLSRSKVLNRHVISSWAQAVDYCRRVLAHRATEQSRVLYLDRKNVPIADEAQAHDTVGHVPVYLREVVKRALELNASAIIPVHNHPSGDPTPSEADIVMTRQVEEAATALGLVIHDHLVVGRARGS